MLTSNVLIFTNFAQKVAKCILCHCHSDSISDNHRQRSGEAAKKWSNFANEIRSDSSRSRWGTLGPDFRPLHFFYIQPGSFSGFCSRRAEGPFRKTQTSEKANRVRSVHTELLIETISVTWYHVKKRSKERRRGDCICVIKRSVVKSFCVLHSFHQLRTGSDVDTLQGAQLCTHRFFR